MTEGKGGPEKDLKISAGGEFWVKTSIRGKKNTHRDLNILGVKGNCELG